MKLRVLLAAPLGALALVAPGTAQAAQDQAQEDTSGAAVNVAFLGTVDVCGGIVQTFTAGLTGDLDQVDLFVSGGTTVPLVVEIRTTSGGAATTTTLTSATVAPGDVPALTPAFISVPLPPTAVVAGTQYAIVAYLCVSTGTPDAYSFGTGPSDAAYGSGTGCYFAEADAMPPSAAGCGPLSPTERDFAFRTHVTVPTTAVAFRSLTASRSGKGVLVRWRTASEAGTLGYHVYREVNGKRVRANARLIPASVRGLHSFRDSRTAPRYWIQEVGLDGTRSWHGPARMR